MFEGIVSRILENKFYILYRRTLSKKDVTPKYVIYNTGEFGGDFFKAYRSLTLAKRDFNRASKEAKQYEKELEKLLGV
jgi:hypothetical protein